MALRWLLFSLLCAAIVSGDSIDPARPHLEKVLKGDTRVDIDEFIFPFVIVQTATTSDKSVAEATEALMRNLRKDLLPYRGHFSGSGMAASQVPKHFKFPEEIWVGTNLSGMKECNTDYCKMKLNTQLEKTEMVKAKDKIERFRELVAARIQRYMTNRELRGYEDRVDNTATVAKMVDVLTFLGRDYPKCSRFIAHDFWKKAKTACQPKTSFMKMEVLDLKTERIHPVLRISEVIELHEGDRRLILQLFVYTNHYFDVAVRFFEVFPAIAKGGAKKTVLVATDFMEIDQLTQSSVLRFLYKGRMVSAFEKLQWAELSAVR